MKKRASLIAKTQMKLNQKCNNTHWNHTCLSYVACGVHFANEELQANDGIDDNDKEDQQSDVEQGNHGFNNGV